MPYVQRNQSGQITSLSEKKINEEDIFLPSGHPEVRIFLQGNEVGDDQISNIEMDLMLADMKMIRVTEDLIDLLIEKGIIMFSELPTSAQEKILSKKTAREKFHRTCDILVNDISIL